MIDESQAPQDEVQPPATPPVAVRPEPLVQLGMGLPAVTVARLDRLRAATGFTRGHVAEMALTTGGLAYLEAQYSTGVQRFNVLAENARMTWDAYARVYADNFAHKRYPPTVAELEQMQATAAQAVSACA